MWRRIAVNSGQILVVMLACQGFRSYRGDTWPLAAFAIVVSGLVIGTAAIQIAKTRRRLSGASS